MNEFNNKIINEHIEQYKELYRKQYGENPTSWFSYLQWLSSFTTAGEFDNDSVELVKKLLGSN